MVKFWQKILWGWIWGKRYRKIFLLLVLTGSYELQCEAVWDSSDIRVHSLPKSGVNIWLTTGKYKDKKKTFFYEWQLLKIKHLYILILCSRCLDHGRRKKLSHTTIIHTGTNYWITKYINVHLYSQPHSHYDIPSALESGSYLFLTFISCLPSSTWRELSLMPTWMLTILWELHTEYHVLPDFAKIPQYWRYKRFEHLFAKWTIQIIGRRAD